MLGWKQAKKQSFWVVVTASVLNAWAITAMNLERTQENTSVPSEHRVSMLCPKRFGCTQILPVLSKVGLLRDPCTIPQLSRDP
jgi:hypothetical protein